MEERGFLGEKRLFRKIRLGQRTTKRRGGKTCRGKKASRRRNTSFLNEFLREKYEEVDKIELRASESLSELSEAEGYINTLEKRSNALESKIRAFESENLKLAQQNTD